MFGVALACLAWVCGCAPPPEEEARPAREAMVPGQVRAGTAVFFPCQEAVAITLGGSSTGPTLAQRVHPSGGWFVAGARGLAIGAGDYEWRCLTGAAHGDIRVTAGALVMVGWEETPSAVRLGRSLAVRARRSDVFGNLAGEPLQIAVSPADAGLASGGRVRFVRPGRVTLSARADDGSLLVRRTLFVDSGPPVIALDLPTRGAVVEDVPGGVRVAGQITEDGPSPTLIVNGQPVELAEHGRFDTRVFPPRPGLFVVQLEVTDATGQKSLRSRATLYGPVRHPGEGLEHAARLFMPRWLIDDDEPDLDDLAATIETLLGVVEIPDQWIGFGCQGSLRLEDISLTVDRVELDPRPGELAVEVALRDVSVALNGSACACAWGSAIACVDTRGSVASAHVVLQLVAELGKSSPTSLETSRTQVQVAPLRIHWSFLGGHLDWAVELAEAAIRKRLIQTLQSTLSDTLRGNLRTMFDAVLPLHTIALPPPLDDVVGLETHLVSVSVGGTGLTFDVGVVAVASHDGLISPPTGRSIGRSLRVSSVVPTLPAGKVGLAVGLDVVNDAIYSLFVRGALEDLTLDFERLGLATPHGVVGPIRISATLPPVFLPGAEPGTLALAVGDLQIGVQTAYEAAELSVSFTVSGVVAYNELSNALELRFLDDVEVFIEPVSSQDAATLAATFDDLSGLAQQIVVAALSHEAVSVPLPVLDLSLIKGVPPERAVVLQLHEASLEVTPSGYVVATGVLTGSQR